MIEKPTDYPVYRIDAFAVGLVKEESLLIPAGALDAFMDLSGDRHPLHAQADYARVRGFRDRVCHGLLVSAYVSPFIARHFLGATGLFVSFTTRFQKPVYEGTRLVLTGRVESASASTGLMNVAWTMADEAGQIVQSGIAGCLLEKARP